MTKDIHPLAGEALELIEFAHDAIIVRDLQSRVLYWNHGAVETYGCTKEEATGKITHDLLQTQFPVSREAVYDQLLAAGHWEGELIHTRRDGTRIVVASRQRMPRNEAGQPQSILEINRDITQQKEAQTRLQESEARLQQDITVRKRAEEALRESEARLRLVAENAPAYIAHLDENYRYLFVNSAHASRFGLTPEQVIGKTVPEVLGQEAFEAILPYLTRALAGESLSTEATVNYKGLGPRYMQAYYAPDGASGPVRGLIALAHDTTERRKMEDAVRESDIRFRALADNIAQLAWIADAAGNVFWYNRRWYEYTGTTPEEMQGWEWKGVHHPDHIDRVVEKWVTHLQAGEFFEDTFPLRSKEGEYRRFLTRASPVRDETGQIVRWCGTNTDIEDLEQAQEAIEQHVYAIETLNARLSRAMTETHHRVRNNLQILAAIIDLEAGDLSGALPASKFARLSQHVQALSSIHTLLMGQAKQVGDGRSVSSRQLLGSLLPLHQKISGGRTIHFDAEEVALPTHQATALALITNELVSNALKHGRSDVRVIFSHHGGMARLEVTDDGPGFPEGFDPVLAANTGIELVNSLTEWDLQGSVEFGNTAKGNGRVVVRFSLPEQPPEEKKG